MANLAADLAVSMFGARVKVVNAWHGFLRSAALGRGYMAQLGCGILSRIADANIVVSQALREALVRGGAPRDRLAWKARGVGLYDFGGEYHGEEDAAQVRIAAFKRGFGGEVVPIYSGVRGITLVGRLALEAARLRGAMHRARDGSRKAA
jgi:hypothetical protein